MSNREELAELLYVEDHWHREIMEHDTKRLTDDVYRARAANRWRSGKAGWSHEQTYPARADAILAAGYRKPRTIMTAAELDALPAKSVILDPSGTPWTTDGDKVEPWASVCEDPYGGPIWKDSIDILLPATVLHVGGAECAFDDDDWNAVDQ